MRITKFGHACVRLETGDHTIVLDPGVFTEPEAVDGATAVLITHEHPDHYSADHLRRTDAPVHTIEAVAAKIRADAPDGFAHRVNGRRVQLGASESHHFVAHGQLRDHGLAQLASGSYDQREQFHRP